MPDARVHEPKLAALRAYAYGALRPAARERLERHLASCDVCNEALRGLRLFAELTPASDAHDVPALDWARIESALRLEEARAVRQRRVRTLALVGAGIAAAAWLALALDAPRPTAKQNVAQRAVPTQPAPEAPPPSLRAEVTAIVGAAAAVDAAHAGVAMTLGSLPLEGWTLETAEASEVHIALAETGAFVLKPNSRLELRVLRPGQVELALMRGELVSQVLARKPDQRYDVLAGERRVRVHGTRFAVESSPEALAVQVDEGVVHVLDAAGALLVELRAPQRWVQNGASAGHAQRVADRLPHPRMPPAASARWPELSVPKWSPIVQWQIDGADIAASAELRMRVPPGNLQVVGRLADGRTMRAELRIDTVGARFDPSALRFAPAASSATAAPATGGSLDAQAASAVIRTSQPELQRCYERSMRGQAVDAASIVRVRLRLEIDARGGVRSAELAAGADAAPADLAACIRQVARGWRFAAPGGSGVMFEAPLRFHPLH